MTEKGNMKTVLDALEEIARYEKGSLYIGEYAVALKQIAREALAKLETDAFEVFYEGFRACYGDRAWERDWYGDRLPAIRKAQKLLKKWENGDG